MRSRNGDQYTASIDAAQAGLRGARDQVRLQEWLARTCDRPESAVCLAVCL